VRDGSRVDTFQITLGVIAATADGVAIDEKSSPKGTNEIKRRENFIYL
jgi:hypothetical protein